MSALRVRGTCTAGVQRKAQQRQPPAGNELQHVNTVIRLRKYAQVADRPVRNFTGPVC